MEEKETMMALVMLMIELDDCWELCPFGDGITLGFYSTPRHDDKAEISRYHY